MSGPGPDLGSDFQRRQRLLFMVVSECQVTSSPVYPGCESRKTRFLVARAWFLASGAGKREGGLTARETGSAWHVARWMSPCSQSCDQEGPPAARMRSSPTPGSPAAGLQRWAGWGSIRDCGRLADAAPSARLTQALAPSSKDTSAGAFWTRRPGVITSARRQRSTSGLTDIGHGMTRTSVPYRQELQQLS